MGILTEEERKVLLEAYDKTKVYQISWTRVVKKPLQEDKEITLSTIVESRVMAEILVKDLEKVPEIKSISLKIVCR